MPREALAPSEKMTELWDPEMPISSSPGVLRRELLERIRKLFAEVGADPKVRLFWSWSWSLPPPRAIPLFGVATPILKASVTVSPPPLVRVTAGIPFELERPESRINSPMIILLPVPSITIDPANRPSVLVMEYPPTDSVLLPVTKRILEEQFVNVESREPKLT